MLHNVAGQLTLDSMYVFYRKPRTLVATILCKDLATAAAASSTDHLTGMVFFCRMLMSKIWTVSECSCDDDDAFYFMLVWMMIVLMMMMMTMTMTMMK